MKLSVILLLVVVLASAASAQKLAPQKIAYQKGNFISNYASEDWQLSKGEGPRMCKVFIQFDTPFLSAPTVVVNLTGVDAPTDHGLRISLKVDKVSVTGFLLKIQTWEDSRINGVEGTWFAISTNE
ncbi:MAG TPA: H-type lectin domain-containing protein [Bacteroidota bacterium]|nr:H-type lectin domain-containing protein [Bacteroidota bacterium]